MNFVLLGLEQVRVLDKGVDLGRFEQRKGIVELTLRDLVLRDALNEFIVDGSLDEHGFLSDEFIDGYVEDRGKFGELADVGHAVAALPVRDSLIADAKLVGEFDLCHVEFLSQCAYLLCDFCHVKHSVHPFFLVCSLVLKLLEIFLL